MSGMGKALLILAILLSLGSAAAGYLLSTKKTQYSEQLVAVGKCIARQRERRLFRQLHHQSQ
jgi:hypothetical protein